MATRSKMSLTNEFRMDMARFEIPVSGWTCLRTVATRWVSMLSWVRGHGSRVGSERAAPPPTDATRCGARKNAFFLGMQLTLVDVGGVSLLAGLGALLLVTRSGGLLAGILLLRSLGGSGGGLGGGLLVGGLGRHFGDVD